MATWTEAQRLEHKITRQFHQACKDYALLEEGDRVLVALSGGKDSLELVRLMGAQQRILKPHIEVAAAHVVMTNIPYETDRTYLRTFCEEQGMPLQVLESSFDDSETTIVELQRKRKTRCFLCSWNRRKALFEYAVNNGYNKICLGHHQDDFIITLLMNMSLEGHTETMLPKMQMAHFPLQLIRPLCLVDEADIRRLAELLGFSKMKTICPYDTVTKRAEMADVFHHLERLSPVARYNLWACAEETFPK